MVWLYHYYLVCMHATGLSSWLYVSSVWVKTASENSFKMVHHSLLLVVVVVVDVVVVVVVVVFWMQFQEARRVHALLDTSTYTL